MVFESVRLGDHIGNPCGAGVLQKLATGIHREHHHCRAWGKECDLPGGFKPVHDRHLQVQDHDVRVQLFDFIDC